MVAKQQASWTNTLSFGIVGKAPALSTPQLSNLDGKEKLQPGTCMLGIKGRRGVTVLAALQTKTLMVPEYVPHGQCAYKQAARTAATTKDEAGCKALLRKRDGAPARNDVKLQCPP